MPIEKEPISHSAAFVGTALHTAVDYLAPTFDSPRVEVAEILGKAVSEKDTERVQAMKGMLVHFALGVLLFPGTYNLLVRHFFPRKPVGTFTWAMVLWFTGQLIIMPLCGAGDKFKRNPKRIFVYWFAHVLYGIACSKKSGA